MNAADVTDATDALSSATQALADAQARLAETEAGIASEEAKASDGQKTFADALERGEDGHKQQVAWAKARAMLSSLQERREHLAAAVERRRLDVARATRAAKQAEQQHVAARAKQVGADVLVMLRDVCGEFHELEGLDRAHHAAAWQVKHADEQLGDSTPLAPSVLFASGLGEKVWELLRDVDLAVRAQEERRRRELRA